MRRLRIKWTPHPFISIRCLLYHRPPTQGLLLGILVVGGSPAAAEDAEEPEDAGADGEQSTEPGGYVDGVPEVGGDVVGFEDMVEGCDEAGEEGD